MASRTVERDGRSREFSGSLLSMTPLCRGGTHRFQSLARRLRKVSPIFLPAVVWNFLPPSLTTGSSASLHAAETLERQALRIILADAEKTRSLTEYLFSTGALEARLIAVAVSCSIGLLCNRQYAGVGLCDAPAPTCVILRAEDGL